MRAGHLAVIGTCILGLLALFAWGCGGSGGTINTSNNGGTNGGGGSVSTLAGPITVNAVIQPMTHFEQQDQQIALSFLPQIQALGYQMTQDGAVLMWPTSPASGWHVEFGSQHVFSDNKGAFTLLPPTDGSQTGLLHHPEDDTLVVPFALSDIVKAANSGLPLIISLPFGAPCTMSFPDTCTPTTQPAQRAQPQSHSSSASDAGWSGNPCHPCRGAATTTSTCFPPLQSFNLPRQIVNDGQLGTSFSPNSKTPTECSQEDGLANSKIPGFSSLPDSLLTELIRYVGSTCDHYVLIGACQNERAESDVEYSEFYLSNQFFNKVSSKFAGVRLPAPVIPGKKRHCYQNHKKRNCAMVCVGDLSISFPDQNALVTPSESFVVNVNCNTPINFVVHNNGVYGKTKINKIQNGIGGLLSSSGLFTLPLPIQIASNPLQELHHYTPIDYEGVLEEPGHLPIYPRSYDTDLNVTYKPTANAQNGQIDTYVFMVDDSAITVDFKMNCSPSPSPSPGTTAPWPMALHDAQETCASSVDTSKDTGVAQWTFSGPFVNGLAAAEPVVAADGTIYLSGDDSTLFALNTNGSQKWLYTTGANRLTTAAIGADGTIYVSADDGNIYAVNPDGSKKWTYNTPDWPAVPTVGADGTIYSYNLTSVFALNPNGTLKWVDSSAFTGTRGGPPATIGLDGSIYVGGVGYTSDGSLKWPPPQPQSCGNLLVGDSPTIAPDGTVIGTFADSLTSYNPTTGCSVHFSRGEVLTQSTPAIGKDGTIYAAATDGINGNACVFAFKPDLSLKWTATLGDGTDSSNANFVWLSRPAIGGDGTIYCGFSPLFALNPADGSVKWKVATGFTTFSSRAQGFSIGLDGSIYIPQGAGLTAFH